MKKGNRFLAPGMLLSNRSVRKSRIVARASLGSGLRCFRFDTALAGPLADAGVGFHGEIGGDDDGEVVVPK